MSIKFEGEPPFYLGVADRRRSGVVFNVIVRVTVFPLRLAVGLSRFDLRLPPKLQNRSQNS